MQRKKNSVEKYLDPSSSQENWMSPAIFLLYNNDSRLIYTLLHTKLEKIKRKAYYTFLTEKIHTTFSMMLWIMRLMKWTKIKSSDESINQFLSRHQFPQSEIEIDTLKGRVILSTVEWPKILTKTINQHKDVINYYY